MHALLAGMKKIGQSPQRGPEYHGPCPVCGGRDRFHVWPEQGQGSFWCRSCDKGGDLVEFYRWRDGLSYRDACARAGVDARTYTPMSAPSIRRSQSTPGFVPAVPAPPDLTWATHAAKFCEWCHVQLLGNDQQLAWLADRGIDGGMVAKYGLGWNPADAYRPRQSWGLPVLLREDGRPRKLWLPMGLVIPVYRSGQVVDLRIRQPVGEPRYYVVPGSARPPVPLCSRPSASAYVVVESALDAILLDGLAGDLVGVVAMGNASIKPNSVTDSLLRKAIHISISLDSDEVTTNKQTGKPQAAGQQGSRWWLATYPQAERVPVIGGKDPGDAYKAGVDLRAWVLAGLPPRFHLQKTSFPDLSSRPREGICPAANDAAKQETAIKHYQLTVDGCEIHVTDNRDLWERLNDSGEIVFSEQELHRLQSALVGLDDGARAESIARVIEAKQVFPSAWICRGEVVA